MKYLRPEILALFICICLLPHVAEGGTFCVQGMGLTPQCNYDDIQTCRRAEEPPNTFCSINPEANLAYTGGTNYCVVTAQLTALCIYQDRSQCNEESFRQRGICIDRRNMSGLSNDPFRYDDRVQNY
jgi:hypothetical protein